MNSLRVCMYLLHRRICTCTHTTNTSIHSSGSRGSRGDRGDRGGVGGNSGPCSLSLSPTSPSVSPGVGLPAGGLGGGDTRRRRGSAGDGAGGEGGEVRDVGREHHQGGHLRSPPESERGERGRRGMRRRRRCRRGVGLGGPWRPLLTGTMTQTRFGCKESSLRAGRVWGRSVVKTVVKIVAHGGGVLPK